MPLCTLHLLALHTTTPNPLATFLTTLASSAVKPLVVSRVIRWIILPTKISTEHLLARNVRWDVLLILPGRSGELPPEVEALVSEKWCISAGVPGRLVKGFEGVNGKLLHPDSEDVVVLGKSTDDDDEAKGKAKGMAKGKSMAKEMGKEQRSAQNLELSPELERWIHRFTAQNGRVGQGAVSMFNLLAFNPGMKSEYLKYGTAFAESIGSRHGGVAKIVGNVVADADADADAKETARKTSGGEGKGEKEEGGWDEIALAHYPSISHFRAMLDSADYQEVNHRHRLGSLRDTCILMTSEIAIEEVLATGGGRGAKL